MMVMLSKEHTYQKLTTLFLRNSLQISKFRIAGGGHKHQKRKAKTLPKARNFLECHTLQSFTKNAK
jgi:hypothetical protein